jgi:hypothetical protein
MSKTAVIDADSMVYIVAYHFKDSTDLTDLMFVQTKCQSLLDAILEKAECENYKAAFSSSTYFRSDIYKYQLYKGSRKEKPEWLTFWQPHIKEYYTSIGFITVPEGYEADDFLLYITITSKDPNQLVYCSTDKDVRQIPGDHFDIRTLSLSRVSEFEASKLLYTLMLTGDSIDNVAGIFGIGDVKAAKLLEGCDDWFDMHAAVNRKYLEIYGPYYGPIIFDQTYKTLCLRSWV